MIAFVVFNDGLQAHLTRVKKHAFLILAGECLLSCPEVEFACPLLEESNTKSMIGVPPANGQYLSYEQMPAKPLNWFALEQELHDSFTDSRRGQTYGYIEPERGAQMLYEGTRVPGVIENVPIPFQGVFWMKGNPAPEILATMQYATWNPQEQVLVWQFVPFSWAWWGGGRQFMPNVFETVWRSLIMSIVYFFGVSGKKMATDQSNGWVEGKGAGQGNYSYGAKFRPCPEAAQCKTGDTNFAYATIQIKGHGDLARTGNPSNVWTLEHIEGVRPFSRWRRGIYDDCGNSSKPGNYYTLTKILDENGEKIEPYYSEWKTFVGQGPLLLWSSWGYPLPGR